MDRQDIDALLIGALYGELTPADEARLAAHLESHPADRGALEDLKVARQAVADSRIFAVQLEPPQAISAVLLQEAHRRAPKRAAVAADEPAQEGWFYRFTRSFLAHPAMAAAAMLVLVLGGAGLMYMKKGDQQFANKEVAMQSASEESTSDRGAPAAMAPSPTPTAGDGLPTGAAQGSAYNADLYEGAAADEAKRAESEAASTRSRADQLAEQKQSLEKSKREQQVERRKGGASSGIVVGTETGAVKDFEDSPDRKAGKAAKADTADLDDWSGDGAAGGGGGIGAGRSSAGPGFGAGGNANAVSGADRAAEPTYAQPPPPPAQVARSKSAPATTAAPRPSEPKPEPPSPKKTVAKPSADKAPVAPAAPTAAPVTAAKEEAKPDSALIAWAKAEHQKAIALAQQKNCAAAAKIAVSVSRRAKDYYAQSMATDRALKQCTAYIAQEREREAEQTRKKATASDAAQ